MVSFWTIEKFLFVSVLMQSATTLGALRAEKGIEKLDFRGLIKDSLSYFWRILGIMFIFVLAWFFIFGAFMAFNIVVSILTLGLGSLCLTPLFFLLIPIMMMGYTWVEFSQVAVLSDNMGVMDALSRGWQIIRGNILPIIALVLIVYFGIWIISAVLILPAMIPMWFLPLGLGSSGEFNRTSLMLLLVLFPVMMFVSMIVQGILMAFAKSAWAVAYLRLTKPKTELPTPIALPANA